MGTPHAFFVGLFWGCPAEAIGTREATATAGAARATMAIQGASRSTLHPICLRPIKGFNATVRDFALQTIGFWHGKGDITDFPVVTPLRGRLPS
jgi:hypothetical protein